MSALRYLTVLGSLAVGGCRTLSGPDAPLVASIAIDKPTVSTTDRAIVTVTIVNRSSGPVSTAQAAAYCNAPFQVWAGNQDLGAASFVCTAQAFSPIQLAPGDSVVVHTGWVPQSARGSIGPGLYRLVPSVNNAGARNEVDVTVVPPAHCTLPPIHFNIALAMVCNCILLVPS
jgi:hypothetical protein